MKLFAGVSVSEVPDAETVGGVELPHEELAAGLPHGGHLEDGGGGEKDLDVVLADRQLARVGEVHQQSEGQGVQVVDRDVGQVLLGHVV